MIIHPDAHTILYFGNASQQYNPTKNSHHTQLLTTLSPFKEITHSMQAKKLLLLRQTHGTSGIICTDQKTINSLTPFSHTGDFLITNLPYIGLAVITADCLPIVIYDNINQVIAIIHAGWRGAVAGVAKICFEQMKTHFGTHPAHVQVFFGPSAQSCCYVVGSEVCQAVQRYDYGNRTIQQNLQPHFNLPLFNQLQLQETGIPSTAFMTDCNECTICTLSYCSYRRQSVAAGRQISTAMLK